MERGDSAGRLAVPARPDTNEVPEAARDMLGVLRAATREAHAAIESVPCLGRLLAPDLAVPEYVGTLRRLHAFSRALEPRLAAQLRGVSRALVLVDGSSLRAIEADLAWFGSAPLVEQPEVPDPDSPPAALGALYVLEGSNLGGRIIGRNVARTLGIKVGTGGSFHCSLEGTPARRRWKLFREILAGEIDVRGIDPVPVTAAALETFAALERWMRAADQRPASSGKATARGCPFAARAAATRADS